MAHEESPVRTVVGGKVVDPADTGGIIYDGAAVQARAARIAQERANASAFGELLAVLEWAHAGKSSYAKEEWNKLLDLIRKG